MQRLFRVSARRAAVASASLLAVLLGPATVQAGPLTPASPQARLQSDLFWVTLGVALVVFFAVEGLLIYTSLRFRRRGGGELPEPNQVHGNTRLEIMWTILPALILISLFIVSVRSMSELGALPSGARTIQVTGMQFAWEFNYPESNVKSLNDLRVPVGQPVVLEITSRDVIHSFWVPDLGGKMDANPGLTTRLSFTAEKAGLYRGVCAELCGQGHANMLFNVTAMEPTEFEAWLRQGGQAASAQAGQLAGGPNVDVGKSLVVEKGCGACHVIGGVAGMAGTIGPPLSKVGTVAETRKPGVTAKDYLTEAIVDPAAFTAPGFPPGVMPKLPLTDQERDSIVAYLLSLK